MADSNVKPNGIKEDWNDVKNKAAEAASSAGTLASDAAAHAANVAKETASHAADYAKQTAAAAGEKANDMAASAGRNIKEFGEKIKGQGPQEGMLGTAAKKVGDAVKGSGEYLENAKLDGIAEDLVGLVKRNPIPALLIGVGLGVLIGRATRT